MQPITKLLGIYQITNKINNKIYIGYSTNITFRWYSHINYLMNNTHPNHKLQEDYDTYGLSVFNFSILELLNGTKTELIAKEQEYLNNLDFDNNYNIYNSNNTYNNSMNGAEEFINYINSKWLVPKGITEKKEIDKYKIYKEEDKQDIVKKVIECKLLKLYPSHITFKKVINLMENSLGYGIENGRGIINKRKYTYKLIVDFDEEKINYQLIAKEK